MAAELTGAQVRMARAFLRWTIADLANQASVGISTVQVIEAVDGAPEVVVGIEQTREHRAAARAESLEAIRKAITSAGITFLPDDGKNGVGIRGKLAAAKTPRGIRKRGRVGV